MDSDECTEDQCIRMIQELLQVENSFKMDLMYEEGDTQISITWNDQDQKRVEEDYCEGCKTKELRLMIGGLVEKLVGVKEIKPVITFRFCSRVFDGTTSFLSEELQFMSRCSCKSWCSLSQPCSSGNPTNSPNWKNTGYRSGASWVPRARNILRISLSKRRGPTWSKCWAMIWAPSCVPIDGRAPPFGIPTDSSTRSGSKDQRVIYP